MVFELATRLSRRHEVDVYAATAKGIDGWPLRWRRVPLPDLPTLIRVPLFAAVSSAMVRKAGYDVVVGQGVNTFRGDVMMVHTTNAAKRDAFRRAAANGAAFTWWRKLEQRLWFAFAVGAERFLLKRPGLAVVTVSAGTAREVKNYYPKVADGRLAIVFNGVDCDEFHPRGREEDRRRLAREVPLPLDRRWLLFVGGEWWRKGLRYAIQALRYLDERFLLVVVGKGDERFFGDYARSLGVSARVRFLGPRSDMPAVYRAADALVLPTGYEPFGLVVLEAMACGLPALATPIGGIADYMRDGQNGLFIAADGRDIAAKVNMLFSNTSLREKIIAAGRETALAFSWDRAAATLEGFLVDLVKRKRGLEARDL